MARYMQMLWIVLPLSLSLPCYGDAITADKACRAKQIEEQEGSEAGATRVELLQRHRSLKDEPLADRALEDGGDGADDIYGGIHRYLLVRPCERFAGDGRSGLPRHLVTGECCGDDICSPNRFETSGSCSRDCQEGEVSDLLPAQDKTKMLPPTQSELFGELEGMEHEEYHCEDLYETSPDECYCSCTPHRPSEWLEDLKEREEAGTLPFSLPPRGSTALEFGAGEGQDSRNIAELTGYVLTSVDVSPTAMAEAANLTSPEMLGTGAGQIQFVAYDATALPAPKKPIDFFFDATVYCSIRHMYLQKLYDVWSRLFTPGHTLVNIQCWNEESYNFKAAPKTRRDMEADFEPFFEILHSEQCVKNQGGDGWCFYMKARSPEDRSKVLAERLKMQQAARDGDVDFVRAELTGRSEKISDAEFNTLFYTAQANHQKPMVEYLSSIHPSKEDPFFHVMYGKDAFESVINIEDQVDAGDDQELRRQLHALKVDWERAESQLILNSSSFEDVVY